MKILHIASFTGNIGDRQCGREKSENVIDVDYNKEKIKSAIRKAVYNNSFIETIKKCKNPYGNGRAGKKIIDILNKIEINKELLEKNEK